MVNSLRLSDSIWWHKSRSTLDQVMACCLAAPSHYLNHCWLTISSAVALLSKVAGGWVTHTQTPPKLVCALDLWHTIKNEWTMCPATPPPAPSYWSKFDSFASVRSSDNRLRAASPHPTITVKPLICTLAGNKIVDLSDVVGAAPTTSSLST